MDLVCGQHLEYIAEFQSIHFETLTNENFRNKTNKQSLGYNTIEKLSHTKTKLNNTNEK